MPQTHQTRIVPAPPETVWARLRDFHDMSWAPNVVEQLDVVGDAAGDMPGAKRVLNGAFHETLLKIDDAEHCFIYSIDEGPSPVSSAEVSDYLGIVLLSAASDGHGTLVVWSSSWKAETDEAKEFCGRIYSALLDELANAFR